MKFSSLLALAAPFFLMGSASPIAQEGEAAEGVFEKRQGGTYAITGVRSGGVQPRLEIRTLASRFPDMWNLYLLSMQNFKNMAQNNKLSYYQIAGIHGVPNIPWDGVQANPNSNGAVGYCTHSSILFPTWHRVYLALYEQAFYAVVQSTVNSFPSGQRARWAAAATNLRIPYWDWAVAPPAGGNNIPASITNKYITITTPSGQQTVLNPLFRYDFHPLDRQGFLLSPWNQWQVTLRYPDSASNPTASSRENLVISTTNNNRVTYRQRLYNLFTNYPNYATFSNEQNAQNRDSIESLHDALHVDLGGSNNGHMTYLWWAAFDPVFWIHHANVDRLVAMWQAIYPNSWVTDQVASGSTFTIAAGSTQGLYSPLTPFHKDQNGTPWGSFAPRQWTIFGYTYPEFVSTDGSSGAMRNVVNNLYGPNARATARRDLGDTIGSILSSYGNKDGTYYEYIANVNADRWGLDGSYTVYIFFGEPPNNDPTTWPDADNMIGSDSVFATPGMGKMKMVGSERVCGTVPLTDGVVDKIGVEIIGSLALKEVVPYLSKLLQWRVVQNGRIVPNSQVPGLEITVVSSLITPPSSPDQFPKWGAFETLANITTGKAGGLQAPPGYKPNYGDKTPAKQASSSSPAQAAKTPSVPVKHAN